MHEIDEGGGAQRIVGLCRDSNRYRQGDFPVFGFFRDGLLMLNQEGLQQLLLFVLWLASEQDLVEPIELRRLFPADFVDDAAS